MSKAIVSGEESLNTDTVAVWEAKELGGGKRQVRMAALLRSPRHETHGWASHLSPLSEYPSQCGCGDMIDPSVAVEVVEDYESLPGVIGRLQSRLVEEFAEEIADRSRVERALIGRAQEVVAGEAWLDLDGDDDGPGVWVLVDSSPRRSGLVAYEWAMRDAEADFEASKAFLDEVYTPEQVAEVIAAMVRFHGYDPATGSIESKSARADDDDSEDA